MLIISFLLQNGSGQAGSTRSGQSVQLSKEPTLQQLQDGLGFLVGLRHGGDGGLLQHLRLGHIGGFLRHVGIPDLRLRSRDVGDLRLRQADGIAQLVFALADRGLRAAQYFTAAVTAVTAACAPANVSIAELLAAPLEIDPKVCAAPPFTPLPLIECPH